MSSSSERIAAELAELLYSASPFAAPEQLMISVQSGLERMAGGARVAGPFGPGLSDTKEQTRKDGRTGRGDVSVRKQAAFTT